MLSLCRYLMPEPLEQAMFIMNLVFTIYFVVEFIIRISGQGPDLYFSAGMNWCALVSRRSCLWGGGAAACMGHPGRVCFRCPLVACT